MNGGGLFRNPKTETPVSESRRGGGRGGVCGGTPKDRCGNIWDNAGFAYDEGSLVPGKKIDSRNVIKTDTCVIFLKFYIID